MIEILALSFLLSGGIERMSFTEVGMPAVEQDWYYYTELGASWEPVPFFRVYGNVKTDFTRDPDSYMYIPFHNRYVVGAGVHFRELSLTFEHMCGHPQQAHRVKGGVQYDEGYERISITYDSRRVK